MTTATKTDVALMRTEYPEFDPSYGWYANTRHGAVYALWAKDDPRQKDASRMDEAVEVVKRVVATGKPLVGGWM